MPKTDFGRAPAIGIQAEAAHRHRKDRRPYLRNQVPSVTIRQADIAEQHRTTRRGKHRQRFRDARRRQDAVAQHLEIILQSHPCILMVLDYKDAQRRKFRRVHRWRLWRFSPAEQDPLSAAKSSHPPLMQTTREHLPRSRASSSYHRLVSGKRLARNPGIQMSKNAAARGARRGPPGASSSSSYSSSSSSSTI